MNLRPRYELLPVAQWTAEEARHHLTGTFDQVCREYPNIMQPYEVMLADAADDQVVEIMRTALRDTFRQRWPAPVQ